MNALVSIARTIARGTCTIGALDCEPDVRFTVARTGTQRRQFDTHRNTKEAVKVTRYTFDTHRNKKEAVKVTRYTFDIHRNKKEGIKVRNDVYI